MRFLAKVTIPLEKADDAFKSGELPETMQSAIQRLKPEAAYFFEEDGKRECIFVFNLDVVTLIKPLFPNLGASFHVTPVMNAAEFQLELTGEAAQRPDTNKPDLLADVSPTAPSEELGRERMERTLHAQLPADPEEELASKR